MKTLLLSLLLALASTGCSIGFHRYNNATVVNNPTATGEARQVFAQHDLENLSEGTAQTKTLDDVANPDITAPLTP